MPGYEDLTADQLIYIVTIISIAIIVYGLSHVISSFINWKVSKNIKFHMSKEVAKSIAKEIQEPSWFTTIREWWKKRKETKKEPDPFAKYLGD